MLLVTISSCSIDSEVYSPGDFLDCNHEEKFFSAKFNGKIVFNSFDQPELHMSPYSKNGFTAIGKRNGTSYHINASSDTLFPGSFSCDDSVFPSVSIYRHSVSQGNKYFRPSCEHDFLFVIEEIDFEKKVLCLRFSFTAKEYHPVYHHLIEDGEVIVVEDGLISFIEK